MILIEKNKNEQNKKGIISEQINRNQKDWRYWDLLILQEKVNIEEEKNRNARMGKILKGQIENFGKYVEKIQNIEPK